MNAVPDLSTLSGIEQLRAIFAGRTGYEGIVKTFDLHPVSAEEGFVVFEGSPTEAVYNPLGFVHGGYAATLLDTVMGCAVHSTLPRGRAYTTLEIKVNYVRAIKRDSGPLRAIGTVVHMGGKTATAEARLLDGEGRLVAHATTTCILLGAPAA